MIIDGRAIADRIINNLQSRPRPTHELAVFLVGDDPSSLSFIKKKESLARKLGVSFKLYHHKESEGMERVLASFERLNERDNVGGIVLQLPLPEEYDRDDFLRVLSPQKDVDNLTQKSLVLEPIVLTAEAVLKETSTNIHDMTVAVIGRGFLVGQPIIRWIEPLCKKLITLDKESGLSGTHEADLVISGVGKAWLIDPEKLKPGARVIDFGYDTDMNGNLSGDLDTRNVENLLWYTSTPGGTGPILVAKLFENFYALCRHGD